MNTEGHLLKIKQHVEHEWNAACAADAGTTVSVKKLQLIHKLTASDTSKTAKIRKR